jgi:hypothetical protein
MYCALPWALFQDLVKFVYSLCDDPTNCLGTANGNEEANQCLTDRTCKILTAHELTEDGRHLFHTLVDDHYDYGALAFSADQKMVSQNHQKLEVEHASRTLYHRLL